MLFRISKCKCSIERNVECRCPKVQKIPLNKINFFVDQCGPRLLTIDTIQNNITENCVFDEGLSIYTDDPLSYSVSYAPSSEEYNNEIGNSTNDEQLKVTDISLQNYALALDRTGTSDRYGSLLATTLIKDLKISIAKKASKNCGDTGDRIFEFLDDLIIDKNKIRRERAKFREEAKVSSTSAVDIKCISYDGKRDRSLKKQTCGKKVCFSTITEENITIVKEPKSTFIGYTTPTAGTGVEIQKAIVNFLNSEGYSLNYLVAINCDGTAVNTGYKTGVNACMERYLQRPLQWNVCLFHFNELPLKKLMTRLIGKQTGPGIWTTPLGSEILECNLYPVVNDFEAISMGIMPDNVDDWNIRGDQLYLYHMILAINNGVCHDELACQKPGPVSAARWLTTASRLLRLYVSKSRPSDTLRNLVTFVVKVYGPFWFLVKSQPQCIHGSRHIFKYIHWIRKLPLHIQEIIRPTIEHNSYYLHPENILLAMITDPDPTVRFQGYEMIRAAREDPPAKIREFHVPKNQINFDCKTYTEIVKWDNLQITEPPSLHFYTDNVLVQYQNSFHEIIEIPEFPCHSQNTERFVRVVSDSANKVVEERRMGYIFAKIRSREQYGDLNSRQNFS